MKKWLVGLPAVLSAASALAQGQVVFNNRVTGSVVARIYAPLAGNPGFSQIGNGSADTPAGTQDWSAFTLIAANGTNGLFGAATTFAQLLGADGQNQPESSLQPAFPTTTFRTGLAAGFVFPVASTFTNIQWFSQGTVQMVVWDNSSGLYPTWTEASAAWAAGLIAGGKSGLINVYTGSPLGSPATLIGLESFNLYYNVPEPSLIGLAGLGAGFLLLCRFVTRNT